MGLTVIGRQTLVETESGPIEIVHTDAGPTMQFNCKCMDALRYCSGMCCHNRHMYNTPLTEEEATRFQHYQLAERPGEKFIAFGSDMKCVYLDRMDGTCTVHETKPMGCRIGHCSPGGKGEGITQRDEGHIMIPVMMITVTPEEK